MFWFFGREARGISAPGPGIEPAPSPAPPLPLPPRPALEGKVPPLDCQGRPMGILKPVVKELRKRLGGQGKQEPE